MIRTTALAPVAAQMAAVSEEPQAMQTARLQNGVDCVATADTHVADHIAIMELTNVFENGFDTVDLDAHIAT